MYDAVIAKNADEDFTTITTDDIDKAFNKIIPLHFAEVREIPRRRIFIEPDLSGRTLGGAVWKITTDTESILYAVEFNHAKELSAPSSSSSCFLLFLVSGPSNISSDRPFSSQNHSVTCVRWNLPVS